MADLIAEPLRALLDAVASGRYPAPDGSVTVAPQSTDGRAGVFGFTAHTVIVADVDPAWVKDQLPDGDLAAPLSPRFLAALSKCVASPVLAERWVTHLPTSLSSPP